MMPTGWLGSLVKNPEAHAPMTSKPRTERRYVFPKHPRWKQIASDQRLRAAVNERVRVCNEEPLSGLYHARQSPFQLAEQAQRVNSLWIKSQKTS